MGRWIDGQMDGLTYRWTDRRTDRWTDGWTDGQMVQQTGENFNIGFRSTHHVPVTLTENHIYPVSSLPSTPLSLANFFSIFPLNHFFPFFADWKHQFNQKTNKNIVFFHFPWYSFSLLTSSLPSFLPSFWLARSASGLLAAPADFLYFSMLTEGWTDRWMVRKMDGRRDR
jgi:hypothetical protein